MRKKKDKKAMSEALIRKAVEEGMLPSSSLKEFEPPPPKPKKKKLWRAKIRRMTMSMEETTIEFWTDAKLPTDDVFEALNDFDNDLQKNPDSKVVKALEKMDWKESVDSNTSYSTSKQADGVQLAGREFDEVMTEEEQKILEGTKDIILKGNK